MRPAWRSAVLLVALLAGTAAARAETPEELFTRGNLAYQEQRYSDAAEAYRTVLRYQIRDARVEYNLANSEFRQGHLGLAILHFERARRLDPADPDIRSNLDHARSLCFDRVETAELPLVLRALYGLQDRLGPDLQAWCGLGLFWIIAAIVAWGLAEPGRWRAAHAWLVLVAGLLLLITAASWRSTYERLEGRPTAVVLADEADVLAGPGRNNPKLFTVHEGLTLEVEEVREEWIQVSLPNGLHGWLPREAADVV